MLMIRHRALLSIALRVLFAAKRASTGNSSDGYAISWPRHTDSEELVISHEP